MYTVMYHVIAFSKNYTKVNMFCKSFACILCVNYASKDKVQNYMY